MADITTSDADKKQKEYFTHPHTAGGSWLLPEGCPSIRLGFEESPEPGV